MGEMDARSLSAEAKEALRIRTVRAVMGGLTQTKAAEVFSVKRQTVNRWCQSYLRRGKVALQAKRLGRPKSSTLKGYRAALAARLIGQKCPDELGLSQCLWTRKAVAEFLAERFGHRVSLSTAGRYLRRWGFTPQKPVRRAFQQDPENVKKWLEVEYPRIARRAKRLGAEIHWSDEAGVSSTDFVGRSYGRRGATPVVRATGQRYRCNVISSLTNQGALAFMVFGDRFNSSVFLKFLRRLIKHANRRIFVIVDGHPVHRSKKVARWLKKNKKRIEIYFLPPYSPELNPDELLNNDIKSNAFREKRHSSKDEMMSLVRRHLASRQKQPHIVSNFFMEKNVLYAASVSSTS